MNPKQHLEKALAELSKREIAYETACKDAATAEHTYKMAYARAFKKTEGTRDERLQQAYLDCEDEHEKYVQADAVKAFTKEKLKDAQNATSARQSLLSSETQEMKFSQFK